MSAQLIGLVAKGKQDEMLIEKNIEFSFFKHVYRKQTSMSLGINKQLLNNKATFGNTLKCSIERKGDLLTDMMFHIKLPKIKDIGKDSFNKEITPLKENSVDESRKNKYSSPNIIEVPIQTKNNTNGNNFLSFIAFLEK